MDLFEDVFEVKILNRIMYIKIKNKHIKIEDLTELEISFSHTKLVIKEQSSILKYKYKKTYKKMEDAGNFFIIDYDNYDLLTNNNSNDDLINRTNKEGKDKKEIYQEIKNDIKIPPNLKYRFYVFD